MRMPGTVVMHSCMSWRCDRRLVLDRYANDDVAAESFFGDLAPHIASYVV